MAKQKENVTSTSTPSPAATGQVTIPGVSETATPVTDGRKRAPRVEGPKITSVTDAAPVEVRAVKVSFEDGSEQVHLVWKNGAGEPTTSCYSGNSTTKGYLYAKHYVYGKPKASSRVKEDSRMETYRQILQYAGKEAAQKYADSNGLTVA